MKTPTIIDTRYLERMPDALLECVSRHASGPVWAALETASRRGEGPLWFVLTTEQNALCAVEGGSGSWTELPLVAESTTRVKRTRQTFLVNGEAAFEARRIGFSKLERAFELAFQPRVDGLYQAALEHMNKRKWDVATQLLDLAEAAVVPDARELDIAYLSREQRIHLAQAVCAMRLGQDGNALVLLAALSDGRRGDDLLQATEAHHEVSGWLLTLALAHEEAGQPGSAARVYEHLFDEQPDDVLLLARARALRRADENEEALNAYTRFLAERGRRDLSLTSEPDEIEDLAAACLESARLLEQLGRPGEAAQRYLRLLRGAPLHLKAYERLFALRDVLEAEQAKVVTMASEVLHVLNPRAAAELSEPPPRHRPVELPAHYETIDEQTHDKQIVHHGERASSTLARRWIGILTRDERDTRDIERHAQRVDEGSHATVWAILRSVSKLAGVAVPRLYLSHGSAGIEVLGASSPFVLLGACHLNEGDERKLEPRELAFALGSQVEHIRADHVLLTSSEFWRAFGTKSATAVLAFLPLGKVVSHLTDRSLLAWLKKLGGSSSGALRNALDLAAKRIEEGATGEGVQSAYSAALAKVRRSALEKPDDTSLVKERLADFARAAQYTADRVGLLAADDISAAIRAILRLSSNLHPRVDDLATEGLVALIQAADGDPALEEFKLRVTELLKFALSDEFARLRDDHVS